MREFLASGIITLLAVAIATCWGGVEGLFVCLLLIALEISFSFDNAVVNATVLKRMNALWQKRFLTWGMVIAVFGMYYLFPLLIVALATGNGLLDVAHMAVYDPYQYTRELHHAHISIAAFGGMFLLMVFFSFIMNEKKKIHWLGKAEEKLSKLGKLEAVEAVIALLILLILQNFLPHKERLPAVIAGVSGVVLYVSIHSMTAIFGFDHAAEDSRERSGMMGFIYLALLDASFSLDAVIGSFAISHDIVIIVLGLTAGAMFVRSLTVHMVRKNTLKQYVFLEHGAHYGIGALAIIMLISMLTPVPEAVAGLIGLVFIGLSLYSSIKYNHKLLLNGKK